MKFTVKSTLSLMIAMGLATASGWAQEEPADEEPTKPGLYTTVDEAEIYLIQGDQQIDVKTGQAVFVTPDSMQFIDRPPPFLNWPCGTGFAGNRGQQPTFALEDLPADNRVQAIVNRWFTDGEVLETLPRFRSGEFHLRLPADEIEVYVDQEVFWYTSGPADAKQAALRPPTLLIGMFRGTGQVVVDTNHLEDLKAEYGDETIPVLFLYHDENVVPVSYFGPNATPGQVLNAYVERGIKAADVPMQFAGDRHLAVAPGELANSVGAPPLSDISPGRRAQLEQDIAARGFRGKPVNISMLSGSDAMLADEAERIRVAESMGIESIPVMFTFFSDSSPAERCGVAPPVAAVGALGLADPAGEIPPDPITVPPESSPPEVELPPAPPPEPIDPEEEVSDN